MKYTFTCEDDFSSWKNSTEFYAESLDDVLENFGYFLKGCTFHIDGQVDIVNDQIESTEDITKSPSSMDFILDSLSTWTDDSKKLMSQTTNCGICNLPLDIMSRHDCYHPGCPIVKPL